MFILAVTNVFNYDDLILVHLTVRLFFNFKEFSKFSSDDDYLP